jgi:dynein heavy chain 1
LVARLTDAIEAWNLAFEPNVSEYERKGKQAATSSKKKVVKESTGENDRSSVTAQVAPILKPTLMKSVHEIVIRNQVMHLEPPLEHARVNWVGQLHSWLGKIQSTIRVNSPRHHL